jgi:hypothetical protein
MPGPRVPRSVDRHPAQLGGTPRGVVEDDRISPSRNDLPAGSWTDHGGLMLREGSEHVRDRPELGQPQVVHIALTDADDVDIGPRVASPLAWLPTRTAASAPGASCRTRATSRPRHFS